MSEHVHGAYRASAHSFIVSGVVDPEVVSRQSRTQIKNNPNYTIIVHHHSAEDNCKDKEHDAYGTSLASALV
jgi:hypothetical protein